MAKDPRCVNCVIAEGCTSKPGEDLCNKARENAEAFAKQVIPDECSDCIASPICDNHVNPRDAECLSFYRMLYEATGDLVYEETGDLACDPLSAVVADLQERVLKLEQGAEVKR